MMKILTYGRLGKEFESYINQNFDGLQCYYADEKEVAGAVKDYEHIAGLALPEGIDISHVRWVHAFSAGVDYWVSRKDLHPELVLTKTIGRMGQKMGEYCLGAATMMLKSFDKMYENQKVPTWQKIPQEYLFNQKVLILGTASIGSGIAKAFKPHVEKVVGYNRSGKTSEFFDEIVNSWDKLESFTLVINALPLTRQTSHIVDNQFFEKLQGANYINIGRGGTTDHDHLQKAIEKENIKKAFLDVFPEEPLPHNSPLWSNENIIISPHQSAVTDAEDVRISFPSALEAFTKSHLQSDHRVDLKIGY